MERIVADTDRITSCSNQMMSYINDFDNEIKKFDSIIEEVNEIWKGEDALKFVNAMYKTTEKNLRKLSELLKVYAKYLSNVPSVYETIDNEYSKKKLETNKEGAVSE